jgi:SAM-dependent methyltransferase
VALGLLEREAGRFRNTAESAFYLDPAKPAYAGRQFLDKGWGPLGGWDQLSNVLRTGRPVERPGDLRDGFADEYADPARREQFLREMTAASLESAHAIVGAFPWAGVASFADIGCAQGGFLAAIAKAHPQLRAIGFDLPVVGPTFAAYVAEQGIGDRVVFSTGNFFTDALPSADVLVMGHILHDWDLSERRTLIAKAFTALPKGGVLLVYDLMFNDAQPDNLLALVAGLNMLLKSPGGGEYPVEDCETWLREAGFEQVSARPLPGAHTMVVGTKPA